MDWVTFIVAETKAVAWPAVVFTVAVILRRQLSGLITQLGGRLTSAKGGGIELSFAARIDEVQMALPTPERSELAALPNPKRADEISELVALPPAYIVSQAWLRVEKELRESVTPWATGTVIATAPVMLMRTALKFGFISDSEFQSLDELRKLRNEAAHARDPNISLTDALRYDDIATILVHRIREQAKHHRPPENG